MPNPATNVAAVALTAAVARVGAIPDAPATAPGSEAPEAAGIPAAAAVPKIRIKFGYLFTAQELLVSDRA